MARKRASFVGPANPADADTGLLKPIGEQSAEQRRESEKASPRPKVVPKDSKKTQTITNSRTGKVEDRPANVKFYKEPVQKREKPKVKTVENLKEAEIRTPTNAELSKKTTAPSTAPKAKRNRKPRSTTKTGKPLDPKTGRIVAPRPGQIRKLNGEVVRVDASNIDDVTKESRTTVLPKADRDKVEGATSPTPRPVQRVTRVTSGIEGPKGAGGNVDGITSLIGQARSHLAKMTLSRNTPEFHEHHENFNLAHAELQKVAPAAHTILGIMRHVTVNVTPESSGHFEAADKALGDTLSAYRTQSTHNQRSARFGAQERLRRIKAEREGTSE